ncbi:MAG: phage tail sheath subtilisin-like domain-containing protein [Elusimicrobiota bacterium]
MVETLHPGVYVIEKFEVPPAFEGVGVSTGGFIGVAKKGPTQSAGFVSSFTEFVRKYGGFYKGNYLAYAVRAFFDNGGTRCFIARVAGQGAAQSFHILNDYAGKNTLRITAANAGDWGNRISVDTLKVETTTEGELAGGATSVVLSSVRGIEVGDLLDITDGANSVQVYVVSVNTSTRTITFRAVDLVTPISAGAKMRTSTTHKANTSLVKELLNGAKQAELRSSKNIRIGSVLYIDDGTTGTSVLVKGISGNTVFFDPVNIPATINQNAIVVSQEFNIKVYDEGILVETHEFLSLEPSNETDYVEKRLAGRGNLSEFVIATDEKSTTGELPKKIPSPVLQVYLRDGLDGSAPTDDEYIGKQSEPKSGIYLFDGIKEVNMISTPGVTSLTVQTNGITYCENRKNCMYITETPLEVDTVLEAEEYRSRILNIDSSYAALYWPWIVINDPTSDNVQLNIPPSGAVQGIYADVAIRRGVHKAPANERIRGALGLITDGKNIDYDAAQDILNPIGVNVIRPFSGRGIRVFGERTLWTVKDGRHYVHTRRTLIFIEETIKDNSLFINFEPNDEDLWRNIEISVSAFLTDVWRSGALQPRDDKSRAFFVKCDAESNPSSSVRLGKVICQVGVNITGTAEFVIFYVTGFDGGRLVEELG